MNILMSAFNACCLWPLGECCRVLVMLYPKGARCIGVSYACPHPLLTVPAQFAVASLCLRICFATIEPRLGLREMA